VYVSHTIHYGYCQPLHYMSMYHIWYNMFIDNLSVEPIAVYHIGYTPAVERQNHSPKKYMEICVLYHIWYKMQQRVKILIIMLPHFYNLIRKLAFCIVPTTHLSCCTGLDFMAFIIVAVIFLTYILGHYTGFSNLESDFFFWKILFF
jgi:hypothetical protein